MSSSLFNEKLRKTIGGENQTATGFRNEGMTLQQQNMEKMNRTLGESNINLNDSGTGSKKGSNPYADEAAANMRGSVKAGSQNMRNEHLGENSAARINNKSRLRKFKKESMIYGIPVKNHSKNQKAVIINTDLAISQKRQAPSKGIFDKFIILPDALCKQIFDVVIIILSLVSTITAAYFACFGFPTSTSYIVVDIIIELCFATDIFLNFFLQYKDEKDLKPVREHKLIALRYLKGFFFVDFLATLPLVYIIGKSDPETQQLVLLLKLLRLPRLKDVVDTKNFQDKVKYLFKRRLKRLLQNNPKIPQESNVDNNKIMLQISIMYGFRVLKLVVTMLIFSYFLGTLWYIFSKRTTKDREAFTFYNEYKLWENEDYENLIIVIYFAFTTLSTVGFGDFNPKSELERIITTFILLIGVAIFSFIMGDFISILMSYQTVTADNEDSENLSKWLGLLAHFNKNRPLSKDMTKRFEQYFEYYWQHDKNYAIQRDMDQRFMSELPKHIKRDIYKEFLFKEFLYTFKTHFKLLKSETAFGEPGKGEFTWEDNQYQQFMIKLLQNLEPRFYQQKEKIFEEGEEVNEQIYVTSGSYSIGFYLNNKKNPYFHVKLQHKTIIGGYENLFGYESEFCFKALTFVEGYGLRKMKMKPIMDKFPDFKSQIQSYMVNFHYKIIRQPMLQFKKEIMIEVGRRQDMEKIVADIDQQINDAAKRYEEEFENKNAQVVANQDVTSRNVKKLGRKVNNLAKSVHELFKQFDDLNASKRQGSGNSPILFGKK